MLSYRKGVNGANDDSIYLLKDSGDLEKVRKHSYDSEDLIKELIEKYPELLAVEQVNPNNPIRWILVKREVGIPDREELGDRWSVDHLFLDQTEFDAAMFYGSGAKDFSMTQIRQRCQFNFEQDQWQWFREYFPTAFDHVDSRDSELQDTGRVLF